MQGCNDAFEQELAGYRFVGGVITPITSTEAIDAIEKAQEDAVGSKGVKLHLRRAVELLSDRKSPDYRNSVKESISAVESICRAVAQDPNATLGDALKAISPSVTVHPALPGLSASFTASLATNKE